MAFYCNPLHFRSKIVGKKGIDELFYQLRQAAPSNLKEAKRYLQSTSEQLGKAHDANIPHLISASIFSKILHNYEDSEAYLVFFLEKITI